jgi:hypothetical protein
VLERYKMWDYKCIYLQKIHRGNKRYPCPVAPLAAPVMGRMRE